MSLTADKCAPTVAANDVFDDLREENERLSRETLRARVCLQLLDKLVSRLSAIRERCECEANAYDWLAVADLEDQYKRIICERSLDKTTVCDTRTVIDGYNFGTNCERKLVSNFSKTTNEENSPENGVKLGDDNNDNKEDKSNRKLRFRNKSEIRRVRKSSDDGYRCAYEACDYRNRVKGNVARHVKTMHTGKTRLECGQCGAQFWGVRRLVKHKQTVHNGHYVEERRRYRCDVGECGFESNNASNWRVHRMRHTGERPFACGQCGARFVQNSDLRLHELIHSEQFAFVCEWPGCERRYKTRDRLKRHFNWHTSDHAFVCDWTGCESKFKRKADLLDHKTIHDGIKNFACDWPECGMRFRRKSNLRLHVMIHRDDRPFVCEWPGCEARFRVPGKLRAHKLVHSSAPAFVCEWPNCGKGLRTHWGLKLHVMAHRDERPFKCPLTHCQRRFVEKRRMQNHFNTHKSTLT